MYSSTAASGASRPVALSLAIDDSSQVGEARRAAVTLGTTVGMNDVERGNLALIVTEAASNLVRHTAGGRILLQPVQHLDCSGWVDVFSLDKGPGMRSVANALRDGHSTAGTAGQGLGAIVRLSDDFDVFSTPDQGTVLFARVRIAGSNGSGAAHASPALPDSLAWGVVSLPMSGESVCGDAWAVDTESAAMRLLVADGLGHGPGANEASSAAVTVFEESPTRGAAQTLQTAHDALRPTRGAAAAIARIFPGSDRLTFAGVGNIQAYLVKADGATRGLVSYNGTIGHQAYKFVEMDYEMSSDSRLVLASDGLTTQWQLERYAGLLNRHPAVIAGLLYRDYCRGRDDATVVVVAPALKDRM